MSFHLTAAFAAALAFVPASLADLTEFGNEERDAWFDAAGGEANVTTIGFTGYSDGTPLNDQYQEIGVTFTDPNAFIAGESIDLFLTCPRFMCQLL